MVPIFYTIIGPMVVYAFAAWLSAEEADKTRKLHRDAARAAARHIDDEEQDNINTAAALEHLNDDVQDGADVAGPSDLPADVAGPSDPIDYALPSVFIIKKHVSERTQAETVEYPAKFRTGDLPHYCYFPGLIVISRVVEERVRGGRSYVSVYYRHSKWGRKPAGHAYSEKDLPADVAGPSDPIDYALPSVFIIKKHVSERTQAETVEYPAKFRTGDLPHYCYFPGLIVISRVVEERVRGGRSYVSVYYRHSKWGRKPAGHAYSEKSSVTNRTLNQLKLKYKNLKAASRKRLADEKVEIFVTGGGEQKNCRDEDGSTAYGEWGCSTAAYNRTHGPNILHDNRTYGCLRIRRYKSLFAQHSHFLAWLSAEEADKTRKLHRDAARAAARHIDDEEQDNINTAAALEHLNDDVQDGAEKKLEDLRVCPVAGCKLPHSWNTDFQVSMEPAVQSPPLLELPPYPERGKRRYNLR
ncbi:hypothetical protein JTE90_018470 [Oedothorax gibbosus]|uniref:Uncharacterized protein n=1 Tax=Oedothorax gibbosus TaxID=931172 RepID=A0AAV6UFU9_9ARAC|nr:hypothetical protein JTE90_018470 [Oedothorax gibbosus]